MISLEFFFGFVKLCTTWFIAQIVRCISVLIGSNAQICSIDQKQYEGRQYNWTGKKYTSVVQRQAAFPGDWVTSADTPQALVIIERTPHKCSAAVILFVFL